MKLKLVAVILGATLALASLAFAQGTAPADVVVINVCLKKVEQTGSFGGACVGLVADRCIKAAEGTNDDVARMKGCATRELAICTRKMDEALQKVEAGGFADVIKAVKESQTNFRHVA